MSDEKKYPQGKLMASDEGELELRVEVVNGKVVVDFGKSLTWFGMDGDQAMGFAMLLIKRAKETGFTRVHTIDL